MASAPARFLWVCDRYSPEELVRALLLAEKVRLPFSRITPNPVLEACAERGRIELFPAGAEERWFGIVASDQQAIYEWSRYFGERMCRAFAERRVVAELHETGHRISWAWDDGSGAFPEKLYPRGDFYKTPTFDMDLWDRLERELTKERFGASAMEANYAVNAAPDVAMDKLLIDVAMADLAGEGEPYSRLGLLAQTPLQLKWLVGTAQRGVAFEPMEPRAVHSVVNAMLGRSSGEVFLSQIPIDRFLDLCDELREARHDFALQVARWSESVAAASWEGDAPRRLAALTRDEIVPAMRAFNKKSHRAVRSVLGAISGGDFGRLALAGVAVASALVTGALTRSPEVTALTGLGAAAAGTALKHSLTERAARRSTWTAFASALSDELGKWRPRKGPLNL